MIGNWGDSAQDIAVSGRGVMGLAPEPTHHGFHILLLGATLALLDIKNQSFGLVLLCFLESILLAQSSSSLMCLLLAATVTFFIYSPILFISILIALFLIPEIFFVDINFDESNNRIVTLILEFIKNPLDILNSDYSLNVRLAGVFATFSLIFSKFLIPEGLLQTDWLTSREYALESYDWLMGLSFVGPPSGFGILIYQGGIFSLIFCLYFISLICTTKFFNLPYKIIVFSSIFIFFNQYYISASGFSLILAAVLYRKCTLKNI
ncbi:hypothetical protein AOC10_01780 [Polynucleobacter asymbioticus]|nr:hypothetical protein AOC10_01780 [Polynucleobacter asymbioticus]